MQTFTKNSPQRPKFLIFSSTHLQLNHSKSGRKCYNLQTRREEVNQGVVRKKKSITVKVEKAKTSSDFKKCPAILQAQMTDRVNCTVNRRQYFFPGHTTAGNGDNTLSLCNYCILLYSPGLSEILPFESLSVRIKHPIFTCRIHILMVIIKIQ